MRLGEWVWSAVLAFLISTGIAIWLELYPDLPDWVKVPAVAQATAGAELVTELAGKAAGGLLAWLVFPIQLIKAEVKDVIFVRNVDQKAAAVAEREAAVAERAAAVAAERDAVAERAAAVAAERAAVEERAAAVAAERDAVAERAAAVAAERDAVLEWYEQYKEQLPDAPPPPGIACSGYNGNGAPAE